MKNIILIILLFFALLEMTLIILLVNNQHDFDDLYSNNNTKLKIAEQRIDRYEEKFDQSIFSENTMLNKIELVDSLGNNVVIDKIIDGAKLVYRFAEVSCRACVDSDLEILNQLGKHIGNKNIIVLSDFENINKMNSRMQTIGFSSPYYNFKGLMGLSVEKDSLTRPGFFFIIDKDLRLRFVYKTDESHDISSPYFRRIIQYFKNGI
jgi:hypothetical protein